MITPQRRGKILIILEALLIVAVLAGRFLAHHASQNTQANQEALRDRLRTLRSQIEIYKLQHAGRLPDGDSNLAQLTTAANTDHGSSHDASLAGDSRESANASEPGLSGSQLPVNPLTNSNQVRIDAGAAGTIPTPSPRSGGGWIYRPATGEVWADGAGAVDW